MSIEPTPSDTTDHTSDPTDQAELMASANASGDASVIADAIGLIARSYGMSKLSRETGIQRQTLYRALSDTGNPTLETLMKVLPSLNLKLSINRIQQTASKSNARSTKSPPA